MWIHPKEMSELTYKYCRDVKDRPKIRNRITESEWELTYRYHEDV